MILVVLTALCVLTVPLTGGRLSRLAALRLRWLWLAPLALAVQVVIVTLAPGGNATLHQVAHLGTYAFIGVFLCANRALVGARTIALGAMVNTLVIALNDGVMPAARTAQRLAGLSDGVGFTTPPRSLTLACSGWATSFPSPVRCPTC